VHDLSRGLIVDSGNDACVALADYIAGGEAPFVRMMNDYAQKLGLHDTHFETVHGLDAPDQHSSAWDLAVLSRAIIHGEPDFTHLPIAQTSQAAPIYSYGFKSGQDFKCEILQEGLLTKFNIKSLGFALYNLLEQDK
jgi:D-alanyl-D-alanine carboxypeptidase